MDAMNGKAWTRAEDDVLLRSPTCALAERALPNRTHEAVKTRWKKLGLGRGRKLGLSPVRSRRVAPRPGPLSDDERLFLAFLRCLPSHADVEAVIDTLRADADWRQTVAHHVALEWYAPTEGL